MGAAERKVGRTTCTLKASICLIVALVGAALYVATRAALPAAGPRAVPQVCDVPAVSEEQLRAALASLLLKETGGTTESHVLEQFNQSQPYAPLQAARALFLLRGYIERMSACPGGARGKLQLACEAHESAMGYELALLSESVRRATVLANPTALCASTFIALDRFGQMRNTPGALLQFASYVEHNARVHAAVKLGLRPQHVLWYPTHAGPSPFGGGGYLAHLFGLEFDRPCVAEVERICNVKFNDGTRAAAIVMNSRTSAWANMSKTAARALPRPRVIVIMRNGSMIRTTNGWEKDISPAGLRELSSAYLRARLLVPLPTPYVAAEAQPQVNVAMHVRAGSGRKGVPEHAFLPMLNELQTAASSVGGAERCVLHVHVLHEFDDGVCCNLTTTWGERMRGDGVRVFVHMNTNRLSLWHTMWRADFLLASKSKMPRTIATLSSVIRGYTDGEVSEAPGMGATHLAWAPCGYARRQNCSDEGSVEIGLIDKSEFQASRSGITGNRPQGVRSLVQPRQQLRSIIRGICTRSRRID
jgi:hypothetical protein